LSTTVYLVAPHSLRTWFPYFLDEAEDNTVVFTGEEPEVDLDTVVEALRRRPARTAVAYSSHETLERDCELVERLRGLGLRAWGQSRTCAALGVDKFRMKSFFDAHSFPSPAWAHAGNLERLPRRDTPLVVKQRRGTQSVGTRLERRASCRLGADELCEPYHDGIEYSVLVYRDPHGEAVFPPVWKGATSPELVPPWRRLRLCPPPDPAPALERRLRDLARDVAIASDCQGFVEVEYLATGSGEVLVLEINPRIAGTMRIAALASGLPIFSLPGMPHLRGDLETVRWAGEVPYSGPPFSDAAAAVFATSRLTLAGRSLEELRLRLGQTWWPAASRPRAG
jgi:phosphoribosylaminoimidazole carboxylase (NCAIR synthetase)